MIGIDDANNRNAEFVGFSDGDLVVADVNDEQSVGQAAHVLDAAKALLQFGQFALQHQAFLLGHLLEGTFFAHLFHVLEALDRQLDRLEVGQHAAQPALVDKGHTAALGLFGDDFTRLALGADKQDGALLRRQFPDETHRLVILGESGLQIDDVDLVAMTKDERSHLGIPETGLVAEVNTGLQHLAHGSTHKSISDMG